MADPTNGVPPDIDGCTLFQYGQAPTLTLVADKQALCAGGWNQSRNDYSYLKKETGQLVVRGSTDDPKPEPHIATVIATVSDSSGHPLSGQTIIFTWEMPAIDTSGKEAPLSEVHTVTTGTDGIAQTDVISGNETTQTFDTSGNVTGDHPITVRARWGNVQSGIDLSIKVPDGSWQFQDAATGWQDWQGDGTDLYSAVANVADDPANSNRVPLHISLMFQGNPVAGHRVNWKLSQVLDKAGEPVLPATTGNDMGQYIGYGHLSGDFSTTDSAGVAPATYTLGDHYGNLNFTFEDDSIYTPISSTGTIPRQASRRDSEVQPNVLAPGDDVRSLKEAAFNPNEYSYVRELAAPWQSHQGPNPHCYPAPSGEEDDELLPETRSLVEQTMQSIGKAEAANGFRTWKAGYQNQYGIHPGTWYYSQVVGDDPQSRTGSGIGSHWDDMGWQSNGRVQRAGAAFDIVLSNVNVFGAYPNSDTMAGRVNGPFYDYIQALRNTGIVCWHRWAGDGSNLENEIHCIDPACYGSGGTSPNQTLMKTFLQGQVDKYLTGTSGSSTYTLDFAITPGQKQSCRDRKLFYDNIISDPSHYHPGIHYSLHGP